MTPLEQRLRRRIQAEGPITFAQFMSTALYDLQDGYYAGDQPRTGWQGDFVTSAELHPLFGELWARFFRNVWVAAGRPDRFLIVEVGPGEGAFAHALLSSMAPDLAAVTELELVERFPAARARQLRRLEGFARLRWTTSLAEIEAQPWGCLFANEVLDNLPVHLATVERGELRELWVDARGDGLELVAGEPSTPALAAYLDALRIDPPEGAVVEVCLGLAGLVAQAARCVRRGAIVFVDYGVTADDLRARPRSTLAAYSAGQADADVLRAPGRRDLTAHVCWDALRHALQERGYAAIGPVAQRDFLSGLGLAEAEASAAVEMRRALAGGQGPAAVRALSRRSAAGLLGAPTGLGSLGVCLGLRGLAPQAVMPQEEGAGSRRPLA